MSRITITVALTLREAEAVLSGLMSSDHHPQNGEPELPEVTAPMMRAEAKIRRAISAATAPPPPPPPPPSPFIV